MADHQHSGEVSASPFAPFRHRAFFWLWLGVVIASIGSWGQTVGAQWLFVNDPNAATIVPLVQTASTLPMMLLALPAGVLADAFDRRWMMFVIQVYFITVSALLAFLTALGRMPPALLLTFTFAVGAGQAMLSPTWQAMITELVPRSEFAAATRLDMVSVNVSRAAGPAIAGFVIASWGVPPVFALNVATGCALAVILLAWRRPTIQADQRERFLPALRSGSRYVRHEPVVRTILLRFATFIFPAGAVWALLPLVASRQLGLAANGYGLLGTQLRVPESQGLDRSPLAYWDTPRLQVDPESGSGPVVVSIQYEVDDDRRLEFLDAMRLMRRSRLRSGSTRWDLYRVGEDPHLYVEQFEVPSWHEHQRQHEGRLTAEDKAIEDAAFAHVVGSPRTQHLLPATTTAAEAGRSAELGGWCLSPRGGPGPC